jgi:hypothetical protein
MAHLQLVEPRGDPPVRVGRDEIPPLSLLVVAPVLLVGVLVIRPDLRLLPLGLAD